jgi:hypothetical protein
MQKIKNEKRTIEKQMLNGASPMPPHQGSNVGQHKK